LRNACWQAFTPSAPALPCRGRALSEEPVGSHGSEPSQDGTESASTIVLGDAATRLGGALSVELDELNHGRD